MGIFYTVWIIWLSSEIIINRSFRTTYHKLSHDKGTLRMIWITLAASITSGVLVAIFTSHFISHHILIPYTGLLIILMGLIFRFYAIISLGRFFSVNVSITTAHKLKTDGIYRYIRHPSYLGSLVSFAGMGLSLNNWISLIIIFVPVLIAMLNRIRIEEKVLTEHFGNEYLEYKRKTKRLIPFVY